MRGFGGGFLVWGFCGFFIAFWLFAVSDFSCVVFAH